MKILVTGSSGFMGAALCKKLEKEGHALVKLDSKNCDLTESSSLDKFNDIKYDLIFHLAAWTQAGDFCLHHPGEQWIINQKINTNALSWWSKYQPQAKFISIGTSCAYDPSLDHEEENYLNGTPEESLMTYAMTKRMLYLGMRSLNSQFGLKYLCVVPNTLYGPGYHTDGRQMHFIFDLIRKILRGKFYGEKVILWGDGNQKREIVYLDDFIDVMLKLSKKVDNDIINVAPGQEHTIKHYAEMICKNVGYNFDEIVFDATCYVGARSKCLDTKKLQRLLPDTKLTPCEVGVSRTIDWFIKNRDKLLPP